METPAKERMRKLRGKREGRALTVWLYPDADRRFRNIKAITGDGNDAIIAMALEGAYETVFFRRVHELAEQIRASQAVGAPKDQVTAFYRDLVAVLRLDFDTADGIKKTLNQLEVPNYSGKTGTWKVDQVRRLMNGALT
jgi:hypothetical protein